MPFYALWLALTCPVISQFVPAPTDLTTAEGCANITVRYKQVPPGICELDPNVKSYSGYADVAPDQHIFFWFFEARNTDPTEAPLTVWLNGGPGASSMIGLFQENGPCQIDSNGNVFNNPYSWTNMSNMLYIDQPTQVGFSYSIPVPAYTDQQGDIVVLSDNNCPDYATGACGTYSSPNPRLTANSTDSAAPSFWSTLQGFMGVFPQYSTNGFHLAGESYGGFYVPVFSDYIMTQNAKNVPGACNISLQTAVIGNGYIDPLIIYESYYNFTVAPGNTYDYHPFNASISDQMYNGLYGPGNCVDQMKDCATNWDPDVCNSADIICSNEVDTFYNIVNRDYYDIRELSPDPFPYDFYNEYLNTPSVQSAIGAYQNYSEVTNLFGFQDIEVQNVEHLRNLLEQGVNVMMYNGDADYICNWISGEIISNEIGATGFSSAGYVNISTLDGIVHGQVKQSGPFSFARIYYSGHEVPFYQPLTSLTIFERAISGRDIATGEVNISTGYRTLGPASSNFREGNATVQFSVLNSTAVYNTTTNEPDTAIFENSGRRRGTDSSGSIRTTGAVNLGWPVVGIVSLVYLLCN